MSDLTLRQRLDAYERLMRLDKPIGTLLLLWPTMWAVWIAAEGAPSLFLVWIFALGTLLMRSAGVVMNDYADRHFDPHVERTKNRPLAAGVVSEREALLLASGVTLCAFLLILPLHRLVWALSVVALFLAASYPLTKRFLAVPQAYLGIAFGFGIPMAFAAQLHTVPPLAWTMLAANIFWAIGYDTCYAMVDRDDDLKIGIKTSAITFGRFDVAAVMASYAATLGILAWVGAQAGRGIYFYAGLAVAAGMMLRHYYWIRGRERMACFRAFMDNNWVGAVVFAGLFADYALRSGRWPTF
ncbi:MAG: 4-hydroxybenzoate octaprenyltransferase [Rhodocyclaceae bacterium]|nr:4-hydroxybenzoate octaprenyltransferase [Rhodocyclaceae bacterium]MBV6412059.1 4-hydroxybenzoate octaprenyltransferase [Rhodocyclaceae bacterium]